MNTFGTGHFDAGLSVIIMARGRDTWANFLGMKRKIKWADKLPFILKLFNFLPTSYYCKSRQLEIFVTALPKCPSKIRVHVRKSNEMAQKTSGDHVKLRGVHSIVELFVRTELTYADAKLTPCLIWCVQHLSSFPSWNDH